MSLFGGSGGYKEKIPDRETDEIGWLRYELAKAKREIEELREALGSNHPLGSRRSLF